MSYSTFPAWASCSFPQRFWSVNGILRQILFSIFLKGLQEARAISVNTLPDVAVARKPPSLNHLAEVLAHLSPLPLSRLLCVYLPPARKIMDFFADRAPAARRPYVSSGPALTGLLIPDQTPLSMYRAYGNEDYFYMRYGRTFSGLPLDLYGVC